MTIAHSSSPKLLLVAASILLFARDAHGTSLYYLYDSSGVRLATIDPLTLSTAIPASQIKPGAVTAKLFPDYSTGVAVSAWKEYPTADPNITGPGWLIVFFAGPNMNAGRVLVGPKDSTPTIEVFRAGDDINGNTKVTTAVIPIPANTRFMIQNGLSPDGKTKVTVGASDGSSFENLNPIFPSLFDPNAARFYKVDRN